MNLVPRGEVRGDGHYRDPWGNGVFQLSDEDRWEEVDWWAGLITVVWAK